MNLPDGWQYYDLGELLSYEQPTKYIVESTDYRDDYETPVLTAGKTFVIGHTNETKGIYTSLPAIIFDDFTTASQYVNFKFKVKSSAMKILKTNENVAVIKFLYYMMQIIDCEHSTHKRYWIQTYSKYKIPLPPLSMQEHIVSKIDELFSEIDKGAEALRKTKEQLKIYRQAVLKEAFEGVINDARIPSLRIKDTCNEVKVGIVIKPAQYYTDSRGVKAFRSANVREFLVNDIDWVYLTPEGHQKNKKSEVHSGDVLIVRSGYPGTACVVSSKFDGCNAIDILIAVPNTKLVTPEYLCAFTNSPFGKKLVREKKRGVAQSHLNVGGYSDIHISIPPLGLQSEIVMKIEKKLSDCEYLERTVNQAIIMAERLKQSILKKAFEGKLL